MILVKPRYDYWTHEFAQLSRSKFYILSNYLSHNKVRSGYVALIDIETYKEYHVEHGHKTVETMFDSMFTEVVEA